MLDTFTEYVGEEHMLTRARKQIDLPWSRVLISKATTRGNHGPAVRMRMALKAVLKYLIFSICYNPVLKHFTETQSLTTVQAFKHFLFIETNYGQ